MTGGSVLSIARATAAVLLVACSRDHPAPDPSARADTPATLTTSTTQAPPTSPSLECPAIDSLAVPDSLTFFPAIPRGPDAPAEPEYFCFALADGLYQIGSNGTGARINRPGSTPFRVEWQYADGTFIEGLLVRPYANDILLVLQVTDHEGAAGEITRLDRPTLRQTWSARIPAFNIGAPLIDGDVAYVTALGFVGRVNLTTGRYDWSVRDLYDHATGYFNSVESITLRGDTVAFAGSAPGREPRILSLHRETGAVLQGAEANRDPDRPHN